MVTIKQLILVCATVFVLIGCGKQPQVAYPSLNDVEPTLVVQLPPCSVDGAIESGKPTEFQIVNGDVIRFEGTILKNTIDERTGVGIAIEAKSKKGRLPLTMASGGTVVSGLKLDDQDFVISVKAIDRGQYNLDLIIDGKQIQIGTLTVTKS